MTAEFTWTAIANYGFPIVVAAYLLVRMETTISKLTLAVNNLTIIVSQKLK